MTNNKINTQKEITTLTNISNKISKDYVLYAMSYLSDKNVTELLHLHPQTSRINIKSNKINKNNQHNKINPKVHPGTQTHPS